MGLLSFLFQKNKIIRSTQEAEMFREVFRENYELYVKVGKSEDLKRFRELGEYIDSPLFKQRRKEIDSLSYAGSEYFLAEKRYKQLLKSKKLRAYYLIRDSEELKGYLRVKESEAYKEYTKLRVVVMSPGFDKKLHAAEYAAYREIVGSPKIAALIRLESSPKFKSFTELKDTEQPAEFDRLTAFVQSDDFKKNRAYLIDKKRYLTTDDYKLWCEYEELKKRPDIAKYHALCEDPYFNSMLKWEEVFQDDFNTGKLDENSWITRYYAGDRFLNDTYGVGQDVQLYTQDNISFNDSAVCLNFRKESIIGKYWDASLGIREQKYEYTSGLLSSATFLRQKYGRFEAKIKIGRNGLTSCFWLMGDTYLPHIDIMKSGAKGLAMGSFSANNASVASNEELLKTLELGNDYYIFTLEWTKDKLVWMVNDLVVKEVHDSVPDVPMYIGFSLGANEVPSDHNLPGKMEIDWVKVYKLKN